MRLSDMFTRNLGFKFLAVVLAVGLWFMAVGRERAEVGLTVPLEMKNFPADLVVANQVPDGISVRIRGSVPLTRQVADRGLRFSIDLSGAKAGPNHFTLLPEVLGLPRGLEVTRLTPSQVTVELEPVTLKRVNVLPVIKGEPVGGFVIEDIILEPKNVSLRGPQSILEKIDIIWTEPIDVTMASGSTTVPVKLAMPEVSVTLAEKVQITAHLEMREKIVTRAFSAVPVEGINTDLDYKITPETVEVTVSGPLSTMTELASGKALHVRLNLADLGPGQYRRPVDVSVPPDMEVVSVKPEQIQVRILEGNIRTNNEQH
jgi:YbbR domain-containing protein